MCLLSHRFLSNTLTWSSPQFMLRKVSGLWMQRKEGPSFPKFQGDKRLSKVNKSIYIQTYNQKSKLGIFLRIKTGRFHWKKQATANLTSEKQMTTTYLTSKTGEKDATKMAVQSSLFYNVPTNQIYPWRASWRLRDVRSSKAAAIFGI